MRKLRITIGNKSYDVTVEDLTEPAARPVAPVGSGSSPPAVQPVQSSTGPSAAPPPSVDGHAITSPMAGVIKVIRVRLGDHVEPGQPVIVLEAMKMENEVTAPVAGTVRSVDVAVGDSVPEGHVLLVVR